MEINPAILNKQENVGEKIWQKNGWAQITRFSFSLFLPFIVYLNNKSGKPPAISKLSTTLLTCCEPSLWKDVWVYKDRVFPLFVGKGRTYVHTLGSPPTACFNWYFSKTNPSAVPHALQNHFCGSNSRTLFSNKGYIELIRRVSNSFYNFFLTSIMYFSNLFNLVQHFISYS